MEKPEQFHAISGVNDFMLLLDASRPVYRTNCADRTGLMMR
ncbi:MAG: hypothetical protein AABY13_05820 [Nanoarchaeota archaeon]